jgi:hypothetical protein
MSWAGEYRSLSRHLKCKLEGTGGIAVFRVKTALAIVGVLMMPPWAGVASAGNVFPVRMADTDAGDGNRNVDLAVRQVVVSPVRAHVGDVVRVEMLIENKAEGSATTNAEVYANGKRVGRQLFTWGLSPGDQLHRLTFDWDTRGLPAGEYRIKTQAFVWEDASPFDNELSVPQPVILVAPGAYFPGGDTVGGSATETDPRFGKSRVGS